MGLSVFPAPSAASKTMFRTTLTSGTSWTVPTGVTYVNVTLFGGGGGGGWSGGSASGDAPGLQGHGGSVISSTLSTTPGASIAYAIGAGGAGSTGNSLGSTGGTTTFTGATSADGGTGGAPAGSGGASTNGGVGTLGRSADNGGGGSGVRSNGSGAGGTGGAGKIDVEYWV